MRRTVCIRGIPSRKTRKKPGFQAIPTGGAHCVVFTRNKMAMFLLGVIIVLLLFTFIQPYLPGQRDPIVINNE